MRPADSHCAAGEGGTIEGMTPSSVCPVGPGGSATRRHLAGGLERNVQQRRRIHRRNTPIDSWIARIALGLASQFITPPRFSIPSGLLPRRHLPVRVVVPLRSSRPLWEDVSEWADRRVLPGMIHADPGVNAEDLRAPQIRLLDDNPLGQNDPWVDLRAGDRILNRG